MTENRYVVLTVRIEPFNPNAHCRGVLKIATGPMHHEPALTYPHRPNFERRAREAKSLRELLGPSGKDWMT